MAQYPLIHAVIVLVVVIVVKQSFFDGRTPWLHVLYRHTYNTLSAETTTATASLKSKGDRDGLIKDLQSINQLKHIYTAPHVASESSPPTDTRNVDIGL